MSDVKMAVGNSARGQMRPHSSKSPPFLLVGLFVVIAILGFNYWNASTKYAFSRKQVIQISDKYQELNLKKQGIEKRNMDLLDELSKRKTAVMECLAKNSVDATSCENRIRREKDDVLAQLQAVKLDADNVKQKGIDCQDSLKQCQTDLDNTKEAAEHAKSEINAQCEKKVKKAVQDVDAQSLCASVKSTERVNILEIVKHRLGMASLRVLQQSGIDMAGVDMDQGKVLPSRQSPGTYQVVAGQQQLPLGQGQPPQVQLGQEQPPQLGRGQHISPGLQQQQPGQEEGQVGQQQPPSVGGQPLQQPQQPGQGTQQQPDDNQQQQKQLPELGSQQQPGDNQQQQKQLPVQGSQQQPGDNKQQQQLPGLGSQPQPGDNQQQQQQLPGPGSQQQPGDNQQQQQPDHGQGNTQSSLRTADVDKAAEIGVGASTVTLSNVSVTQPEGRVNEGVMGRSHDRDANKSEISATTAVPLQRHSAQNAGSPIDPPPASNATGPQMPGLGSIAAPPGGVALDRSLPAALSSVGIATSNETRQVEQNVVSTPRPDNQIGKTPGTKIYTFRTYVDTPDTKVDDAPGTKKEHSNEDSLRRGKQEQHDDAVFKQIKDGAFQQVDPPHGRDKEEIDVGQLKPGGQ